MALWPGRERVALGFGPDRVRLLTARANGALRVLHADAEPLAEGALRVALRAPTLDDRDAVLAAVRRLVERARAAGRLARTPDLVAVVLFDGAVKMAIAPLEGGDPGRDEGERMACWVLRDVLPVPAEQVRVDWATIATNGGNGPRRTASSLFSVGAHEALVAEYEGLVRELGWHAGRVVPWTLAAAAAQEQDLERTLLLCEGDGALAGAFEDGRALRFHRAWRARVAPDRLAEQLASVQRFLGDHLEVAVAEVVVCGTEGWLEEALGACRAAGLPGRSLTAEQALLGALRG